MGKFGKQLRKLQHAIVHHEEYVKFGDDNIVPSDVPVGSLAVYVGDERHRFVIKVEVLKHDMFHKLLAKTAEEFGYKHDGGLIIACDVALFEHLMWLEHAIEHHEQYVKFGDDNIVPSDVPAGSLAVYVGDERHRFVIKAKVLKHDVFHKLLAKTAEEFGYKHDGGLIIACDVALFEYLLWLVETKSPILCHINLQDYWAFTPNETTYHMVD